jgi:hypothetical protein
MRELRAVVTAPSHARTESVNNERLESSRRLEDLNYVETRRAGCTNLNEIVELWQQSCWQCAAIGHPMGAFISRWTAQVQDKGYNTLYSVMKLPNTPLADTHQISNSNTYRRTETDREITTRSRHWLVSAEVLTFCAAGGASLHPRSGKCARHRASRQRIHVHVESEHQKRRPARPTRR